MNDFEKLTLEVENLKKQIADLNFRVETLSDGSYKGKREFFNKEVQFNQKCYRADGTLITQINT